MRENIRVFRGISKNRERGAGGRVAPERLLERKRGSLEPDGSSGEREAALLSMLFYVQRETQRHNRSKEEEEYGQTVPRKIVQHKDAFLNGDRRNSYKV